MKSCHVHWSAYHLHKWDVLIIDFVFLPDIVEAIDELFYILLFIILILRKYYTISVGSKEFNKWNYTHFNITINRIRRAVFQKSCMRNRGFT